MTQETNFTASQAAFIAKAWFNSHGQSVPPSYRKAEMENLPQEKINAIATEFRLNCQNYTPKVGPSHGGFTS